LWTLLQYGQIPPTQQLLHQRAFGDFGGPYVRRPALERVLGHMERLGWIARRGGREIVSDTGLVVLACAAQYGYPLAYLPTLCHAEAFLLGGETTSLERDAMGDERHVDRAHDIRISGQMFSGATQAAFFELLAPIFDHKRLDEQPQAIVDTGSGDGTLLRQTYTFVRAHCQRGACLDRYPLMMIGVEPNRIARDATHHTLDAAGIPHRVLDGDITAPQRLRAALRAVGFAADDCLHVSKSVVHNRTWCEPQADTGPHYTTTGVFVAPNGDAISPACLEQNLHEWFESWRPLTWRHGMVVIEAHTVPPETAFANVERSIVTMLDLTHAYSQQYLVEPEVFRAVAVGAGYRILEARDLGSEIIGHTALTINRLQPGDSPYVS
jgi:hypothetical protein